MINFDKIIKITILTFCFFNQLGANTNYFAEGIKFYEKKEFKKAKFKFEQSLVLNPKNENSYLYLSKIFNIKEKKKLEEQNLKSVILTSQLFLPGMIKKKWGRIINLTSLTAKEPGANFALSNITRAGVVSFSKTLSQEVAKYGVTVNSILTGGVLTDRLKSLLIKLNKKNKNDFTKQLSKISKLVPNGYIANPNEFIQMILFLATSNASYVNGSAITVDGGSSKSLF